jgi:uncharacterized protein YbjT (DUF2867 family)
MKRPIGRKDESMNSEEGKIIVVIGATGRQGREVVRQLVGHGWRVKGVTRKPESKKASAVRALGAELVPADLDNITTLESALQGAYGLYTMQPPILGRPENEIQQGKNVALAAQKMKVRHVVYGSAGPENIKTGIEQWDTKLEVTQVMMSLDLPLTTLRPLAFMELMTDPSYYPNVIWYIWPKLTGGDRKIPWISVQDVGVIAAKAFANPAEFLGKDLVLSADVQSLDEYRAIYKEVKGKYPSRFPMPMFLFEKFVGKDIPRMWRWLRTNPVNLDTSQTRQIHPEVMSVRTWLASS